MPYLDQYKDRVLLFGKNEQERIENKLSNDFYRLCLKSPDKCTFTYLNQNYTGILSSGARSAAQSESKIIFYLWGPKTILLPEGAVITTFDQGYQKNRYWIIMNQEVHPFYGYFKYKILELDYILNYIGTDGIKHSIHCYVNGTGTFDIKEYFKFSNKNLVEKSNRALNIIWSSTDDMDKDCRFIIGNETWKYIDSDKISIPGVSYSTLFQIGIDESEDNINEQIAGTSRLDSISIISNYGDGIEDDISISDLSTDLKFYLFKDGKIIKSNFEYQIDPNFAILNDNNNFELIGNDGYIIVKDINTNYSKQFNFIIDQIRDYFFIIGNKNIDVFSLNQYEINTDYKDFTFEYDEDKIIVSLDKNKKKINVKAKSILGETKIIFKYNNLQIGELILNIGSSWS